MSAKIAAGAWTGFTTIVAKLRLGDPAKARAREKQELKRSRNEPSFDGSEDSDPEIAPEPEKPRLAPAELVERSAVADKGLKLGAGTYVVQVGKRKFARVTLAA